MQKFRFSTLAIRAFKENTLQHFASTVDHIYCKGTVFLVGETLNKLSHAFAVILNAFLVPFKSMFLHTTSTSLVALYSNYIWTFKSPAFFSSRLIWLQKKVRFSFFLENVIMQFVWEMVKSKDQHERELSFNCYC